MYIYIYKFNNRIIDRATSQITTNCTIVFTLSSLSDDPKSYAQYYRSLKATKILNDVPLQRTLKRYTRA